MQGTTASGSPIGPGSLQRVLEEAFDLGATRPDLARSVYAQLARAAIREGLPWEELSRLHHTILADRLRAEPDRSAHWIGIASALLATLSENLHARLLAARSVEEEKTRLDARLEEQAQALDDAAHTLQEAIEKTSQLSREVEVRASMLSSVLDAMRSAVVAVDTEGKLLMSNAAARAIAGVAPGTLPGATEWTSRYRLRTPGGRPLTQDEAPLVRALRGESIERDEVLIDHGVTGETHFVEVGARPLLDGNGTAFGSVVVFTDLTERHRTEQRLADSETRLRVLLEASPQQVWSAATDGSLEYANPHMLAYFGATATDFPLARRNAGVHPDDLRPARVRWEEALANPEPFEVEARLRRADGEYRWHLIRAQPLRDPHGRVLRWFGVNFDVEDLKRAQQGAEHATRMKSAFLSSMSHEIRTPMNAVLGFSSLLQDTPLDDRQHEFLTSIRASGEHLLGIINNILDFSKMEAGLLELDPNPFGLRPLAEAALDIVSPNAADQGVELGCLIRDDVPTGLVADEGRLRQVLVNLLGNAVKFTARGEVVLGVSARPAGEPGRWIFHFTVRDTGIGIPKDVLPRLFQEFSQGESSTARRYGGTGLGLAISKRIVDLHGGRIWAESEEGRGSTFHLELPADEARELPARLAPADLGGLRVLAVDDNASNCEIVRLQAESWGMVVRVTRDPHEALGWVRDGAAFDVAVVDQRMPGMDGVELAQALRATAAGAHLPIVMLSSLGGRVRSTHFAAVLTKPVHQSSLQQALCTALRLTAPQTLALDKSPEATDLSGIAVLLAEDNVLNQRVARLLLERVKLTADVAFNGREAIEAIARRAYDVVLMDVEMPEMDGLQAAAEIVRRFGAQRPWLIAVTAQALQGDRERCLAAGFNDYLSKPLQPAALTAALARVPRPPGRAGGPANPEAPMTTPTPEASSPAQPSPADAAHCPDFNAEELGKLRESYGEAAVGEIVAALDVDLPQQTSDWAKSRQGGDFKTFSRVAHTLKSTSRMFGANALADTFQALESDGREGRLDPSVADAALARYLVLVERLRREAPPP